MFSKNILERIVWWINEREKIRIAKEAGCTYTTTEIFNRKRFCNVLFKDDKTSRFVNDTILPLFKDHRQVQAAMLFRCFNRPSSFELIEDFCTSPSVKTLEKTRALVKMRQDDKTPMFSPAFMTLPRNRTGNFPFLITERIMPMMLDFKSPLRDVKNVHQAFDWSHNICFTMRFTSYVAALDLTMPNGIFALDNTDDFCHPGIGPRMLIAYDRGIIEREIKAGTDINDIKAKLLKDITPADAMDHVRQVFKHVSQSRAVSTYIRRNSILAHAEYWCCEMYKYIWAELHPKGSKS